MSNRRIILVSTLTLASLSALAGNLYVNGSLVRSDVQSIEFNDKGDTYVTTGTSSPGGGQNPPPPSSVQCPAPSKNVKVLDSVYIAWAYTGSMMIQLNTAQEIHAMSFTTGDNLDFRTQVSFGSQSWTSNFRQHLWISECPGGPPVSDGCDKEGAGGVGQSITWGLKDSYIGRNDREVKLFCVLRAKRKYYMNYQVPSCRPATGIKYPCAGFYKNSPNLNIPFNLDGSK